MHLEVNLSPEFFSPSSSPHLHFLLQLHLQSHLCLYFFPSLSSLSSGEQLPFAVILLLVTELKAMDLVDPRQNSPKQHLPHFSCLS